MRFVLDTSALFSMQDIPPDAEAHTTPSVIGELQKFGDKRVEFWDEVLKISHPGKESLERVRRAAEATGDSSRLSRTDVDVLGLALELSAVILTDDYSIQNVAKYLGIEYKPIGLKGIKRLVKWRSRCTGCGRIWDRKYPECPVCGSELRTYRHQK